MTQILNTDERFRIIVENVKDFAIVTIDLNANISDWNIGAERMLGYSEAEILGKPAAIIFTPEDCERGIPEQELHKARTEGKALDERWHIKKDKTRFWGSGFVEPLYHNEKLVGYVKIFRDMTVHKNMAEALAKTNQELEEFAALASHDLQVPLHEVLIMSQLFERKIEDEFTEYISNVERSTRKMTLLINNLFKLHKAVQIDPGNVEEIDLNNALVEVLENLKANINKSGAKINIGQLPTINANLSNILQVFQNLIDNAIKYAGKDKTPNINISGRQHGNFVEIEVSDNGIGLQPEYIEKIFLPFKRLHGNETDGTGLGLTIVKKIIEKHGGTITVESKVKEGSKFTITLPANFNAIRKNN